MDHQNLYSSAKNELLKWLNNILQVGITKIEQLGNGAYFCQLLEYAHKGQVPLSKVNWNAKLDYQKLSNLKILSITMHKLKIQKTFDPIKISENKYQYILELLQWFRKYIDSLQIGNQTIYQPPQTKSQIQQKPRNLVKKNPVIANIAEKRQTSIDLKVRRPTNNKFQQCQKIQNILNSNQRNQQKLRLIAKILQVPKVELKLKNQQLKKTNQMLKSRNLQYLKCKQNQDNFSTISSSETYLLNSKRTNPNQQNNDRLQLNHTFVNKQAIKKPQSQEIIKKQENQQIIPEFKKNNIKNFVHINHKQYHKYS